ncbi:uncharacterized protein LOC135219161 [Macrobrachium nipponense]|uniref:uncharacterized protein LOC135219161 n=1 Tax=Macrobrachium nipponense TaxID=159736 RepID=UPI0030C8AC08
MVNRESRKCILSPWEELFLLSLLLLMMLQTTICEPQHHPTRVPGSKHLVVQTDFPYEYWRPSAKPYRPAVPRTVTSTPASYGFYYGESSKDHEIDASAWQMLPIQIPDDLVGAVNERTTQATTPAPTAPTYPTTVTPQYGRYPGVTERPHLFHPERLYTHVKDYDDQVEYEGHPGKRPRPSHQQYFKDPSEEEVYQISQQPPRKANRFKKPQNSWHSSILENLESIVATHSPHESKFQRPHHHHINNISRRPAWPYGSSQEEYDDDAQAIGEDKPHHLYAMPRPAYKKRRGNKRPNHFLNSGGETIILSTPPESYEEVHSTEDHRPHADRVQTFSEEDYDMYYNTHQNNQDNQNSFLDNSIEFIQNQIRPLTNRRRVLLNRRRPLRRQQVQSHSTHKPEYHDPVSNDPWNAHLFFSQDHDTDHQESTHTRPAGNRFRPVTGIRPIRPNRPYGNQGFSPNSPYAQSAPLSPPGPLLQRPLNPAGGMRRPWHHSHFASDADDVESSAHDYGIVDRLTDANPLTSSVTLPGGMLVVALALALFYFNFVWYPTPVVTARLIKLISDSVPDDLLDSEKQRAIGEVYEVFRSLETEYIQDPNLWKPSCKSRLVCQVHQELPGLWQITYAYEAVVRRSLATGPQGDDDLSVFLKAAEDGSEGSNCSDLFKTCPMEPVPVRSYLQTLLGIGDSQTLPTIVFS